MGNFRERLGFKICGIITVIVIVTTVAQLLISVFVEPRDHRVPIEWHFSVGGFLVFFGWALGWILTHLLVKDLNTLTLVVEKMARGEWIESTGICTADQIGHLARAFEQMAHKLKETYQRIERDLEVSNERLALLNAILDMAGDGIITVYRENTGSVVRSINRTAREFFGVSEETVKDKPFRDVAKRLLKKNKAANSLTEREFDGFAELADEAEKGHIAKRSELFGLRHDGLWVPIVVTIGQDTVTKRNQNDIPEPVPLVTLIFRDISEQRVYQDTLEKKNQELTNSNRELEKARSEANEAMKTQEVYMANLSHDLRTPLTVVLGYSEEILEQVQKNLAVSVEDAQLVVTASKEMKELIHDSLNYFKVRQGHSLSMKYAMLCVDKLLAEYGPVLKYQQAKQHNKFATAGFDTLGEIYTDKYLLWRTLVNFLSNAFKFTENGTVILDATRGLENGREYVYFRIKDNGIGIPRNAIPRLFQRYGDIEWTRSRGNTGTGIGLHICKMYAELLGGSVELEFTRTKDEIADGHHGELKNAASKLPEDSLHGSVFLLRLPANAQPQDFSPNAPSEIRSPMVASDHDRKNMVLVIEDERDVAELVSRCLHEQGNTAELASNGFDGLRKAIDLQPCAIILDVRLAGIDGWGVLAALKSNRSTSHIPVLLLTVVDDQQVAKVLCADEYIVKPFTKEAILSAIAKLRFTSTNEKRILVFGLPRTFSRDTLDTLQRISGSMNVFAFASTLDEFERQCQHFSANLILFDLQTSSIALCQALEWYGASNNYAPRFILLNGEHIMPLDETLLSYDELRSHLKPVNQDANSTGRE